MRRPAVVLFVLIHLALVRLAAADAPIRGGTWVPSAAHRVMRSVVGSSSQAALRPKTTATSAPATPTWG